MTRDEVIAKMGQELFCQGYDVTYGDQVRALLAHAEKFGYVLIPRCPNKQMVRAACAAMSPGKRPTPERVSVARKHAIRWNAMINAALGCDPSTDQSDLTKVTEITKVTGK